MFGPARSLLSAIKQANHSTSRYQKQMAMTDKLGQGLNLPVDEADLSAIEELQRKIDNEEFEASDRICPVSGENYVHVVVAGIEIDVAINSGTIWFDAGELQVFTQHDQDIPGMRLANRASKKKCPVCDTLMREYQFQSGSNLLVDACTEGHGVLLDRGEFERAIRLSAKREHE